LYGDSVPIERWRILCEQAAREQDPAKLLELVQQINRLLEDRRMLLKGERSGFKAAITE
jgi:hypothetical protein